MSRLLEAQACLAGSGLLSTELRAIHIVEDGILAGDAAESIGTPEPLHPSSLLALPLVFLSLCTRLSVSESCDYCHSYKVHLFT